MKFNLSLKKALAFTLAETLIVMGIIGVVSALVLPNLNSSTGEKEKIAKVKKIYQNLEDTLGRAQAVYGPIDEWFINDANEEAAIQRFTERMTEFMKVSKNCGGSGSGCFSSSDTKDLLGNDLFSFVTLWTEQPMVLLADGTAVDFDISNKDCTSGGTLADVCGSLYIDIDGPKGANTWGKDIFEFRVTKSGIFPKGIDSTGNLDISGEDHAAWIIQHDNMDYLKTTNGKCSNGKVLNWTTNTSCK